MITVFINQQPLDLSENTNLSEALALYAKQSNQTLGNVAVVLNEQIVPKSKWSEFVCKADSQFEVFSAVAGG